MNLKFILLLIGIINVAEGLLGFSLGKVYIRHWHKITSFEALIWLLSGIIFLFISKKMKDKSHQ